MRAISLNKNYQFQRLYRKKAVGVSPVLVTYAAKNRLGIHRVGITTTKKIGKAHQRNRARRIIREAWRLTEHRVQPGYDFVFVARGRTTLCSMQEVHRAMQKHLAPYFIKP
jgi:ribonuclease P protein component